jgi:DNA-binding response OmpR family regulator
MDRLGDNDHVKALVISPDDEVRRHLRVALQSAERRTGGTWRYLEASDGLAGLRVAWRELPDVVVADEIASRAGAFAVAKDLRGAAEPFPGAIVIVLARPEDAWLARWSGADAWIERPIDPFALADAVVEAVERRHPQEVG